MGAVGPACGTRGRNQKASAACQERSHLRLFDAMSSSRVILLLVALAVPFAAATGQRVSASRFQPSPAPLTISAGRPVHASTQVPTTPRRVRKWPFVVTGALVGGALTARAYIHAVNASGDADYLYPVSAIVFVGTGTAVGALGGWAIGSVVQKVVRGQR